MPTYAYTRVSTGRQADEGESLPAQERTVAGYVMMHGLAVDRVFVERGMSGAKPLGERPEGAALLAALRPGDTVITPKLDRMFRSALDALGVLGRLKERGVSLHMIDLGGDVTANGISKLVFTILSAVAEAERDRIRERVAEVKHDQRKRGRYLGGKVPYGFRVGAEGALEPVPEKQAVIGRAWELRVAGAPLRAIQATLQAEHGEAVSLDALSRVVREAAGDGARLPPGRKSSAEALAPAPARSAATTSATGA